MESNFAGKKQSLFMEKCWSDAIVYSHESNSSIVQSEIDSEGATNDQGALKFIRIKEFWTKMSDSRGN